ncbi:MAG: hypothetical protein LM590_01090, partial [Thermofilum sp.]|nr:hypothetical protein [Thermofilum sp.]
AASPAPASSKQKTTRKNRLKTHGVKTKKQAKNRVFTKRLPKKTMQFFYIGVDPGDLNSLALATGLRLLKEKMVDG